MTADQIALKYGLCTCDEIYTSRGLTAPDCPIHGYSVLEAMEEYAKHQAIEFSKFISEYPSKNLDKLYELFEMSKEQL